MLNDSCKPGRGDAPSQPRSQGLSSRSSTGAEILGTSLGSSSIYGSSSYKRSDCFRFSLSNREIARVLATTSEVCTSVRSLQGYVWCSTSRAQSILGDAKLVPARQTSLVKLKGLGEIEA